MYFMELLICRTMFCPKCFASGRPHKWDKFVVYGSSSHELHAKICHNDGFAGYTPHIITVTQPLKYKDGLIELIVGCGVCETSYQYRKQELFFIFKDARYIYLTKEDFNALLMRWIRTGYEIL